MKLSELVDLKLRIEKYFHNKVLNLNSLEHELQSWEDLELNHLSLAKLQDSIKEIDVSLISVYETFLNEIQAEIDNLSALLLNYGYTINGIRQLGETSTAEEDRTFRKIFVSHEFAEQIGSKIKKYTDWKYPTLEIGPGDGFWTNNLVGSDPLYLVDIHKEYLDNTIKKWNHIYGRKVRPYLIGKENNKANYDLSALPKNQVGFIFSWAVFDFLFINEVENYLKNCFEILRPGGKMFFSYNDCDTVLGAQMAEEGKRTWMTKKILKNLFDQIGFKLLEFGHKEGIYHWAEIKKPGRLKSRKVDQPRATIQRRKGFEEVDNEEPIKYNNQQIARIKQLAIQLGIDSPEAIMSDQYDIHGLMHLVNIARTKK